MDGTISKSGCPYYANKLVYPDNFLTKLNPEIAKQWHPTKNAKKTPDQIVAGTNTKYWWKCPDGPDHDWREKVYNRTNRSFGCPCCSGRKLSVTNSLATLFPEVARQWHPELNGDLAPEQIVAGSSKRVWWKCPKGPDHEWRTTCSIRQKHGCPFCRGIRVSTTNSLAVLAPDVALQWHPGRRGFSKDP